MANRKFLARNWVVNETGEKKYFNQTFMLEDSGLTPPTITDVDGDETWDDGDSGLVITGANLLVGT